MGNIKQGILGGFSGTVGPVVGSSWKGISYMRGKAQSVKDRNTLAQKKQRQKFAIAIKFISVVTPYINYGYKNYAVKQTCGNAAVSYIFKNNCIIGEYPDYSIDYQTIKVALGQLRKAENPTVVLTSGTASFNWSDNSGNGNAQAGDIAMALLYNKDKKEAEYDIGNATRADGVLTFSYPSGWQGDNVVAYLSFMSEDGKLVADSEYLGEIAG